MNSSFEFVKGINTIIGENGSGKTNLFRAIRLILDDNLYRFAYRLVHRIENYAYIFGNMKFNESHHI